MRWKLFIGVLTVALCSSFGVFAEPAKPNLNDVAGLFQTLHSGKSTEPVRVTRTDTEFIKSVGAPPGGYFDNSEAKDLNAEEAARAFLSKHAGVFANKSAQLGFADARVQTDGPRSYVRLSQTYAGMPVFAGGVSVQLDGERNVTFILSGGMTDTQALDGGKILTNPKVTAALATRFAKAAVLDAHPKQTFKISGAPVLLVYDPSVVGNTGDTTVAWQVDIVSSTGDPVEERVLVDAATGGVALKYSLLEEDKSRQIFDASGVAGSIPYIARTEGQAASPINDVNLAYQYYGDTYDFYFNHFGRDSIDGAGMTIIGTVRYCPDVFECPFQNAYWSSSSHQMYFGTGYAAADDVVAHELTHGVTEHESNLVYLNESGAINESYSDVFGEFVDQVNGAGNDSAGVKWLMGEDLPGGAIRSMSNPPLFGDPDRYFSPRYYKETLDNGGVHTNSGVNNKLCFLLTDGGFFDGENISPMGIGPVAALYYEAQTHLLVQSATYADLAASLAQAAVNLSWSDANKTNLANAICAVEITPGMKPLRHFRALPNGPSSSTVSLSWANKSCGNSAVVIARKEGSFPEYPTDGTVVYTGTGTSFEDTSAQSGVEYFYSIDIQGGSDFINPRFARVISGSTRPSSFSQRFSGTPDLAFTQILFSPVYDVTRAAVSGHPEGYVNGSSYTATVTKNVTELPVSREDAIRAYMPDEGYQEVPLQEPFPYFGTSNDSLVLYSNGFIALKVAAQQYVTDTIDPLNDFTLASHFEIPRISFLFSHLSPRSGGEVWVKNMDDRAVVTYDKVPEFGSTKTNTVQAELFYSGHIRLTYLEMNVQSSVCGLSDGLGELPGADLSQLGTTSKMTLAPIPIQYVTAGLPLTFTAVASTPSASPAVVYSALYLPGTSTLDAVTGKFVWNTSISSTGSYVITVKAVQGVDVASQIVMIYVADSGSVPSVSDLVITPEKPNVGNKLVGSYTYSSPLNISEFQSIIAWYKNGAQVPQLQGQLTVPGAYTKGGDKWAFSVIPVDFFGNQGQMQVSSPVRVRKLIESDIDQDGFVDAVDIQLVINAALGIDVYPYDADVNADGKIDSIDIQLVINAAVS